MASERICNLHVTNRAAMGFESYPLRRGVPLPPGLLKDDSKLGVVDDSGKALPTQTRVLQKRKDGSIEWVLVEFITDMEGDQKDRIFRVANECECPKPKNPVTVERDGSKVTMTNGVVALVLSTDPGPVIRSLKACGREIVSEDSKTEIILTDNSGRKFRASLGGYKLEVESGGEIRSTVRLEGKHHSRDGQELLDFSIRFTIWADRPDIEIAHKFVNKEQPRNGITIRCLEIVFDTQQDPTAEKVMRQSCHGRLSLSRFVEVKENTEVVSSSVADIDNYPSKAKPSGSGSVFVRSLDSLEKDLSIYPFFMQPGYSSFRAERTFAYLQSVSPYIGWRSKDLTVMTTIGNMVAMHPKSIEIDENLMAIGIWPRWAGPIIFRQGFGRTHEIRMSFADKALSPEEIEDRAIRFELRTGCETVEIEFEPDYCASCEVLDQHHLLKYEPMKYPLLEGHLDALRRPGNSPGGMFSYGDFNNYNNTDDYHVFLQVREYLRTGRVHCWELARDSARHYMESDFCAFSTDPFQDGGLIAHCQFHFEGSAYPSHQWVEGLMGYYYLTGDERARDVIVQQAEHTLRWIEMAPDCVTCDGREAGVPMDNLSVAYRMTGDKRYLDGAYWIVDNFVRKVMQPDGNLRYPVQNGRTYMQTGYGDYSTYYGMFRLWEVTEDEELKQLCIKVLRPYCRPERFSDYDFRSLDFEAAWELYYFTGDESLFDLLEPRTKTLIRTGGRELRRMKWLGALQRTGRLTDAP